MRRIALLPLLGCLMAAPLFAAESPDADELFARGLARLVSVFDASPAEPIEFRTTLEITRGEGLPKAVQNLLLPLLLRCQLSPHRVTLARGRRV